MVSIIDNTTYYTFEQWTVATKKHADISPNFMSTLTALGIDGSQFSGDDDLLFFLNEGKDAVYLLKKYKNIYVLKTLLANDTDYVGHYWNIFSFYFSKVIKPETNPKIAKRCPIIFIIYVPVHIANNILEIFPQWTNNGKVSEDIFGTSSGYPMYELERVGMSGSIQDIATSYQAFKSGAKVSPEPTTIFSTPLSYQTPSPFIPRPYLKNSIKEKLHLITRYLIPHN